MKEKHSGKITNGELRQLSRETMEHVLDFRPAYDVADKSQYHLESKEENSLSTEDGDDRRIPRCSVRAARGQLSDSIPMSDGTGDVFVDGRAVQPTNTAATSEDYSSQQTMEKWTLGNAPPPIKVRREGEIPEESSPQDLSPPPSPKRMRELARKDHNNDLGFSKVFSQTSI